MKYIKHVLEATVECHGEIHTVRVSEDNVWTTGCGDMLEALVDLSDLADAPRVGCQGVARIGGQKGFNGTGTIKWRDGHQEWYLNGKHHRTDGPAVVWPDGDEDWYWRGKQHSEAMVRGYAAHEAFETQNTDTPLG